MNDICNCNNNSNRATTTVTVTVALQAKETEMTQRHLLNIIMDIYMHGMDIIVRYNRKDAGYRCS